MRALFIAAISISGLMLPLAAQDRASLMGKVTDITGAGVPGTIAELESERVPTNRFRTVADAAGVFRFDGLAAGDYDLTLTQAGFSRLNVKSIHLGDGEQRSMPVLQLALGEMASCGGHAVLDFIRFLQSTDNIGNLGGTVRLDEGPLAGKSMPIPGANVTLICFLDKPCGTTTTDSNGEFLFKGLPPRDFSVRVTAEGSYPQVSPTYRVEQGLEKFYTSIYIERCPAGNCDPKLRSKKPLRVCE